MHISNWPTWLSLDQLRDPSTLPGAVVLGLGLALVAFLVSQGLGVLLRQRHWSTGILKRRVDETAVRFLIRLIKAAVYLVGGLVFISLVPGLSGLLTALATGAGVTALVVGFAAKSTLANLISGLSLAVYRPLRLGDRVEMEGEYCVVEDITLRHTIVRSWQGKRLIIPNEQLDNMILVNYDLVDARVLCPVEFGVSYDTDIDLARELILAQAQSAPERMPDPPAEPWVKVVKWGDSSVVLRVYVWAANQDDAWAVRFWLLERVKKSFDAHGVEIPFPYRTVVYKKDLPAPPGKEELPTPAEPATPPLEPASEPQAEQTAEADREANGWWDRVRGMLPWMH